MYLPIFLDITDKKILIIGGGNIALQKIESLLKFTGNITVIATHILEKIKSKKVLCFEKIYDKTDIENFYLVYACTNNKELNKKIKQDAERINTLVNVVDNPQLCDFISPAIHQSNDFVIAVSSGGKDTKGAINLRNTIKEFLNYANITENRSS
ncbi:MAG: bifunctional precorrin-2 dehydrogenase/sirohydrochlorin ferrochelatase [Bacteroidetes bacterium]|nr:bifunctional precorrin-2 dehydrogenase/sirohydrochlorin ferrochelatase [Bacteroidota bacterium]